MNTCDSNSDRISHVPGNILENILMCLPIQDAVRTSLLSRKWRYVWSKLPQLVLDEMFYRDMNRTTHAKLLMIIYQVLLLHRGPIIKFTLTLSGLESCSEIDQLIRFVSSNDIQDFTLGIWQGELYKLPSSLYSCLQLRHLNLRSCMLKPPPGFEGLTKLISLHLYDVVIADDVLSSLISNCPLLEDLSLHSSTGLHSLEVVCPNLKNVHCVGHFRSICFTNTSRLAYVCIYFEGLREELRCSEEDISSSVMLLESVPVIEFLALDFCYVKGLAASGLPTRLPTTLNNLRNITLYDICFGKRDELSILMGLIRSSTNLEEITIKAFPGGTSDIPIDLDFTEVHGCMDVSLNKLRKVDMKNVSGTKTELEFIKLLLAKSPMLETMLIGLNSSLSLVAELRIVGPNLKFVRFDGHFRSICFTNTFHLAKVGMYLKGARKELFCSEEEICSSVMLLESVPRIESLGLDFCYIKGIAASGVPTRLPTTLNNLKHIMLYDICFGERDEVSVLICIIRSSPNLEKITIEAFPGATSAIPRDLDFSEVHGCSNVSLNQLREVDMKNVSGTKSELEFIKFLLAKSPMLNTMLIKLKTQSVSDELRIVKELTRLRRASPQAEMNLVSRDED